MWEPPLLVSYPDKKVRVIVQYQWYYDKNVV